MISVVFDLKTRVALSHFPPVATPRELAHAQRPLCLFPTDGLSAQARVRPLRRALSGQSTDSQLLLFRSIPLHGLRSIDLSREPAGHRNLPSCPSEEALPRGLSRCDRPEHLGGCQRAPRLAHLLGFRPSVDRPRASTVPG